MSDYNSERAADGGDNVNDEDFEDGEYQQQKQQQQQRKQQTPKPSSTPRQIQISRGTLKPASKSPHHVNRHQQAVTAEEEEDDDFDDDEDEKDEQDESFPLNASHSGNGQPRHGHGYQKSQKPQQQQHQQRSNIMNNSNSIGNMGMAIRLSNGGGGFPGQQQTQKIIPDSSYPSTGLKPNQQTMINIQKQSTSGFHPSNYYEGNSSYCNAPIKVLALFVGPFFKLKKKRIKLNLNSAIFR